MSMFGESGIDAAVEWGSKAYFFRGSNYIRVSATGDSGPGHVDPGYPRAIEPNWHFPHGFGALGLTAACVNPQNPLEYFFFSAGKYVTVERTGPTGPGRLVTPAPLEDSSFMPSTSTGPINAAIRWGLREAYFFRGVDFARLHTELNSDAWSWGARGPIAQWRYWNGFGDRGIDDALRWNGGPYVYVFKGSSYIKIYAASTPGWVGRDTASGTYVMPGYPRRIAPHWRFPQI